MSNEIRTFSELIEDLNKVLSDMDGLELEELYNSIMNKKCEYQGGGLFEIK